MNEPPRETPSVPGVPTSPRSLAYSALLGLAVDLLTARFALTRALDKLTTHDLMAVLDEVDETVERQPRPQALRIVTPRDEKS